MTDEEALLEELEPHLRTSVVRYVRLDLQRTLGYADLLQEARLVVVRCARSCRGGDPKPYALFCVRRRFRYLCRREIRRIKPEELDEWHWSLAKEADAGPDYPDTAGLSAVERITLTLLSREGMTAAECAETLGVTPQAVYHRLKRVREKLAGE